jgi:hypothetical protein
MVGLVKPFIGARTWIAYVFRVALEHRTRATIYRNERLGGNAMLPFDSYREVLSEHARGHHLIKSAWVVAAVVAALLTIFA